ncbi:MAG: hypothetical protein JSR37_10390, partial [Verrucomicrobia bacterium]|nr:hypothetical protein [Verrucomicrobiota bacterium]
GEADDKVLTSPVGPGDPTYRTVHGSNFDIVWQFQRTETEYGHIDKTTAMIIHYTDSNKNGIWDSGDDWDFEKYGYQVKSYLDDYSGKQPEAQQVYGTLGEKVSSKYWDQIYIAVNAHLYCDCYTDWIPRRNLDFGVPGRR